MCPNLGHKTNNREDDGRRENVKKLTLRLTDAEYMHLKRQTELSGMKIEPFLRQLILGVQLRPKPPDCYATLLRELSAIGNNVNQIAHWANGKGYATQAEIHDVADLVKKAYRLVLDTL